jgi:NAD(P)-dependent dehydrogenase (short-subunit alcohol dehydrogenase family)
MNMSFKDRVVVVTGAAMGIGEAVALRFAQLDGTVALLDNNEEAGQKTAKSLQDNGMRAEFFACDVSTARQVEQAIASVVSKLGGIDVVVSNAAIQRYGDVVSTSEELWDEVMAVNLKASFLLAKYAVPRMIERGGGAIVVTGSVQSLAALGNSVAYVTAKHGLLGMVRAIAIDHAKQKIRANLVCPGAIDTPMLRWSAGLAPEPDKVIEACTRAHALGRIGRPEEVANAIAFLASEWASFITGAALLVDGGVLAPAGGMAFVESGTGSHQ